MSIKAQQLDRHLMATFRRDANKRELKIAVSCEYMIERMVRQGITRMQSQRALDQPPQIRVAEHNLNRSLVEMAKHAGAVGVLDEACFEKAMKKLCPLWPFC